jgi:hypothetical protein
VETVSGGLMVFVSCSDKSCKRNDDSSSSTSAVGVDGRDLGEWDGETLEEGAGDGPSSGSTDDGAVDNAGDSSGVSGRGVPEAPVLGGGTLPLPLSLFEYPAAELVSDVRREREVPPLLIGGMADAGPPRPA